MDRELSVELRRAHWWRHNRTWIAVAVVIVLLGILGMRHLRPSLDRSTLSIATVERGPVQAIVAATGTVVPLAQQTVASPVSAEIRKVLVSLGEHVKAGQPLMELDRRAAELALNNLEDDLALKRQELRSTDLQLSDAISDARSKRDLLALDLEAQDARYKRLQQLEEGGVVSKQELLEAKLDVKRTQVAIGQIEDQLGNARTRRDGELQRLRQSCVLLEKKVADQVQRLALTSVTAPRSGLVTHLIDQEGSAVIEGQVLATVAGEDAFRVEATLSDFYAAQLKPGQRAHVQQSATETIPGRVARVVPSRVDSQVVVFIDLDDPAATSLRANSRVNAEIVTAEKPDGLRVRRGAAFEAGGVQQVYVLRGNRALRTKVRTGLGSSQMIEVVEGLRAGDQVIVAGFGTRDVPEITVF